MDFAQDFLKTLAADDFYGQFRHDRPGLRARCLPFAGPALVRDIGHIGTTQEAQAEMEQHFAHGTSTVMGGGKAI